MNMVINLQVPQKREFLCWFSNSQLLKETSVSWSWYQFTIVAKFHISTYNILSLLAAECIHFSFSEERPELLKLSSCICAVN